MSTSKKFVKEHVNEPLKQKRTRKKVKTKPNTHTIKGTGGGRHPCFSHEVSMICPITESEHRTTQLSLAAQRQKEFFVCTHTVCLFQLFYVQEKCMMLRHRNWLLVSAEYFRMFDIFKVRNNLTSPRPFLARIAHCFNQSSQYFQVKNQLP